MEGVAPEPAAAGGEEEKATYINDVMADDAAFRAAESERKFACCEEAEALCSLFEDASLSATCEVSEGQDRCAHRFKRTHSYLIRKKTCAATHRRKTCAVLTMLH